MSDTAKSRETVTPPAIRFTATLHRPATDPAQLARSVGTRPRKPAAASWSFLVLPKSASTRMPSRGQVTVAGTLNDQRFQATLQPDGRGGHWLRVERRLREAAAAEPGDRVRLAIAPVAKEPEPKMPGDLRKALATMAGTEGAKARAAWADITPAARRDFIHWITSPKRPETRQKRVDTTCDMLAKGKRRPCCFDRSGMYGKSLSCPTAVVARD